MKLAFYSGLLIVLLPLQLSGQKNQIRGVVFSSEDSTALYNVHIVNKTTNQGTVSNAEGKFLIPADYSDVIKFSSVGYEDGLMILTSDRINEDGELLVYMIPAIYSIREVSIFPYRTYEQFKQAVINLKIDEPFSFDPSYFQLGQTDSPSNNQGFGITIDGPITALYNAFSREGKQMRNYERYLRESAVHDEVYKKYNINIVRRFTGIEDEMEVIRFMQYCKLETTFILQSTEHEILLAVKSCYEAYLKE